MFEKPEDFKNRYDLIQNDIEKVQLLTSNADFLIEHHPDLFQSLGNEILQRLLKPEKTNRTCKLACADLMKNLSRIDLRQSNFGNALRLQVAALQIYSAFRVSDQEAQCLSYTAAVYITVGDYKASLEHLYNALNKIKNCNKPIIEAEILNNIGFTQVLMQDYRAALPFLMQSLDLLENSNELMRLSWTLDSLAKAYIGLESYDTALQYETRCIEITNQTKNVGDKADYLTASAGIFLKQGRLLEAQQHLEQALDITRSSIYQLEYCEALMLYGQVLQKVGEQEAAVESLKQALKFAQKLDTKPLLSESYRVLAEIYERQSQFDLALQCHRQFHETWKQVSSEEANRKLKFFEVVFNLEAAQKEADQLRLKNLALIETIEKQHETVQQLEVISKIDFLTGLLNRRAFFLLANSEYEKAVRHNLPLSLIIFDLDFFKNVNDSQGHPVGDDVLAEVGKRVNSHFRSNDLLGRLGGEEFIILMPGTPIDCAQEAAARLLELIQSPIETRKDPVSITISLGISSLSEEKTASLADLIEQADQALYRAKSRGRNQLSIFSYNTL